MNTSQEKITYQDAAAILRKEISKPKAITLPIAKARGCILARDIRGDSDVPRTDNSAMDGYALAFDDINRDLSQEPAKLKIVGEVRAGQIPPDRKMKNGEAVRIMTGALIPKGADTVVALEETREENKSLFVYRAPRHRGENIRRAGEDVERNSIVLRKGDKLSPTEYSLALLAGATSVSVYARPRVAVLTTGDELVEPGKPVKRGNIRNVNTHLLESLSVDMGFETLNLGIVRDDPSRITDAIRKAFRKADVVVCSGGVSAGSYDFLKDVVTKRLKMKVLFHKVRQKPGKPVLFAKDGNRALFALPGNPVSSFVTFMLYVRPYLLGAMGMYRVDLPKFYATASEPIGGNPRMTNFLRGRADFTDGKWMVRTTGPQGSHILTSLYASNCFIVLQEGRLSVQPGDLLEVWRWR